MGDFEAVRTAGCHILEGTSGLKASSSRPLLARSLHQGSCLPAAAFGLALALTGFATVPALAQNAGGSGDGLANTVPAGTKTTNPGASGVAGTGMGMTSNDLATGGATSPNGTTKTGSPTSPAALAGTGGKLSTSGTGLSVSGPPGEGLNPASGGLGKKPSGTTDVSAPGKRPAQ